MKKIVLRLMEKDEKMLDELLEEFTKQYDGLITSEQEMIKACIRYSYAKYINDET